MAKNSNLHDAKKNKNDEFYTRLTDVSKELMHYKHHFKDKIVFCNCDDPTWSAFQKYFHLNFAELGLKKLISTHYDAKESTYKIEYTGGDDNNVEVGEITQLEGNGDFRNKECLDILDECDIVVTNPPFSLFREYVADLIKYEKKFLIIGNKNAITYKELFPLLKNNKIWLGYSSPAEFDTPDGMTKKINGLTRQFTNLDITKRHEKLILQKEQSEDEFPKYDNYMAQNVNKVDDIPCNNYIDIKIDDSELEQYKAAYPDLDIIDGKIRIHNPIQGVPITFLDKYNPEQFEIIELSRYLKHEGMSKEFVDEYYQQGNKGSIHEGHPDLCYYTNTGKTVVPYMRVLIRKKAGD